MRVTGLVVAVALLALAGCRSAVEPGPSPALALLTLEASETCLIGDGGLPFRSYGIVMQDQRDGSRWLFVENRDPGGPREQSLRLDLEPGPDGLAGRIAGPAIINAELGRMTVFPNGQVTARVVGAELRGTLSGRLSAWVHGGGGNVQSCEAGDHAMRLPLPGGVQSGASGVTVGASASSLPHSP